MQILDITRIVKTSSTEHSMRGLGKVNTLWELGTIRHTEVMPELADAPKDKHTRFSSEVKKQKNKKTLSAGAK